MPQILVVDDDRHQRLLLREILEEDGHQIREATDGLAALVAVQTQRPDLIILDINMPGLDGLQVLRRLHDIDRHLPIILNSAYSAYKEQYVSWLADAYVTKSSNTDDLRHAVANILKQRGIVPPTAPQAAS